jgi:hypothetical protein
MPYLMVNLADPADCRRGIQELKRCVAGARGPGGGLGGGPGGQRGWAAGMGAFGAAMGAQGAGMGGGVAALPLGQKLRRIQPRGIWRHLVAMARLPEQPRSLTEWDVALGLQANKMRSLKAIMAKLENRFAIRFLVPAADAGQDQAGNPRYAIPPRLRAAILRLADSEGGCQTQGDGG